MANSIILIGDTQCGKTSICHALHYGTSVSMPAHESTIGASYLSKLVQIPWVDDQYRNIRLSIWDMGGRPIYYKLIDQLIKNKKAVMIVYSATDTPEFSIKKIMSYLNLVTDERQLIYLVANKIDLMPEEQLSVNRRAVMNKLRSFGLHIKMFEVSAITGYGIADLFSVIAFDLMCVPQLIGAESEFKESGRNTGCCSFIKNFLR